MTQPLQTAPTQERPEESGQERISLEQLWRDYSEALRRFLSTRVSVAADVDDLLHDILLRSHQKLPTLRSIDALRGWLLMIARRAVVDYHRSKRRELPWSGEEPSERSTGDANVTEDTDEHLPQELAACVRLFLARLPGKYRQALEAVELEGKPQKQVAAELGISYSGLKSRVQRGRQMMEGLFRSCCDIALDGRGHVIEASPKGGCQPCRG